MTLYFITGSEHKFQEIKEILQQVEKINFDLKEIQEIDSKKIIEEKLKEALKIKKAEFIVEDSSLYLDCLNGFPGPLIKWLLKTIGNEGIFNLTEKLGNNNAEAKTIIGYARNEKEIYFFEGSLRGKIVYPRGKNGFGWDEIFQPEKSNKTFAEMTLEEKNNFSMRKIATEKLKNFLDSNKIGLSR
ncbi:MAG: RdgB/HAM1 family non-canonical purine NTP pyrophosphatase [Candidatus Pacearchaeota archaeon]